MPHVCTGDSAQYHASTQQIKESCGGCCKHRSSQLFSSEQQDNVVYQAASVNTVHLTDCRTIYPLAKEIGDTIEVH